jgi:protein ImuB
MFACIHCPSADGPSADLPQIAEAFSPFFEQTTPDIVVFRIDGLKRLYGTPAQIAQAIEQRAGHGVNISIAETAEAAILAARNFPGVTVYPDLNALDITTLPLTDEMAAILDSWGIYTIDQLAQLPETGIAERFGPAGVSLLRMARGAVDRPLKIFQPEITYNDRIQLDHPISLLEPLLFLIARMLNDQCEKLESHGMAANEITIRLELENKIEHIRTLRLPIPMRESKALLKLLQMDLEAHPPDAATAALALSLKPVKPRTVQNGIFLPVTPAPDKLELTLARIRGIVGENNVGVPELLNTHHPHPFRLAARQPQLTDPPPVKIQHAFRYFRPPLSATIELQNGRPARITASGIHGKVLNASGPWRTSGDWWTPAPWNRDEWDIALSTAIYRIYREPNQRWFLEGSYD